MDHEMNETLWLCFIRDDSVHTQSLGRRALARDEFSQKVTFYGKAVWEDRERPLIYCWCLTWEIKSCGKRPCSSFQFPVFSQHGVATAKRWPLDECYRRAADLLTDGIWVIDGRATSALVAGPFSIARWLASVGGWSVEIALTTVFSDNRGPDVPSLPSWPI